MWKGIALSRANAQVARDAAQEIEMAQNSPMPNTNQIRGPGWFSEERPTDEPLY